MALTPNFIEIDRLKEFSTINENLDSKLLEPTLIAVQDLHLRQILGKNLYNELKTQIDADTVTALNQTLLNDYIEAYLLQKVVSECMLDITVKLRNKAVMTTSSDNGIVADLTQLSKMQGQYANRAEGYKNLMEEYLCENSSSYPLYCPKASTKVNGATGFFLGNTREYENRRNKDTRYPKKDCCD